MNGSGRHGNGTGGGVAGAVPRHPGGGTTLRSATMRASAWTVVGYGASQLLRLSSNIVLAWLLFPEAFGLLALVVVFIQGLNMFSDVGIQPSIVQNRDGDNPVFLNTAWTIQAVRGIALWIIACIGAYPFALLYGEPLLMWLIPVMGLTSIIAGFNSVGVVTAQRHMRLARLTVIDLVSQVGAIAVMIGWAWAEQTVWAIVAGGLVGAAIKMVASHVWLGMHRHRLMWDRQAASSLLRFGRWIFVSTVVTFCIMQADRLIFGQLIPLGLLGIYSIALTFAMLPHEVIVRLAGAVVFPAYSRRYRETGSLDSVYSRMRIPLVAAGGAGTAYMLLSAPALIALLYDTRYAQAGWMLQFLSIGVLFQVLQMTSGAALLAMGKPKHLAGAGAAKLLIMAVLIPVGFMMWGFPGAVLGYALSEAARYGYLAIAVTASGLSVIASDGFVLLVWGVSVAVGLFLTSSGMLGSQNHWAWLFVNAAVVAVIWAPLLMRAANSFVVRPPLTASQSPAIAC